MSKEFHFVIKTDDPNSARSNTADKLFVRTIAATRSWPAHREKIAAQSHGLGGGYRVFVAKLSKPKQEPAPMQKQSSSSSSPLTRSTHGEDGVEAPVGPITRSHSKRSQLAKPYSIQTGTPCPCAQCREKSPSIDRLAIRDAITTIPTFTPGQGLDPFNCYPVPRKPWFDQVLHHLLTIYGPRGWSALEMTLAQGLAWEWTLNQLALSEPALFYVRLLTGSYDLVKLKVLRTEDTYWLRDRAINSINEAIQDPKRACSEAMILAVGRIALCEYMHGNQEAAVKIHRPAQKRMVEIRGGLEKLNLPSLVVRLVRWSDTVMAGGDPSMRCFKDDERNPNFTMEQSFGAMERWKRIQSIGDEDKSRIDEDLV